MGSVWGKKKEHQTAPTPEPSPTTTTLEPALAPLLRHTRDRHRTAMHALTRDRPFVCADSLALASRVDAARRTAEAASPLTAERIGEYERAVLALEGHVYELEDAAPGERDILNVIRVTQLFMFIPTD